MADLVLILHFAYILAVVLPVFLIPVGAKLGWQWVRSRRLRITHATMMGIVLIEALAGIVCPLTWIENIFRGTNSRSFVSDWVGRLVFYDFPAVYFTVAYVLIFTFIVGLWFLVPPHAEHKNQHSRR